MVDAALKQILYPKRQAVKKVRTKPRPGRLKGRAMTELRLECFERDGGMCQECGGFAAWDRGQLAHIRGKRNHGDSIGNVRWLCGSCHFKEHAGTLNGKIVPAKGQR